MQQKGGSLDAKRHGPVHLVDERDTRNVVSLHLPVDGDGLGLGERESAGKISKETRRMPKKGRRRRRAYLDARDGTKNENSSVKDSKSSLDLDGEVDVT
jgi:hypothetical protein